MSLRSSATPVLTITVQGTGGGTRVVVWYISMIKDSLSYYLS